MEQLKLPKGAPLLIAAQDLQNALAKQMEAARKELSTIQHTELLCNSLQDDNSMNYVALTTVRAKSAPDTVLLYEAELKTVKDDCASFHTLTSTQQQDITSGINSHAWSVWDALVGNTTSIPPFDTCALPSLTQGLTHP